jgi:hypothetical protein
MSSIGGPSGIGGPKGPGPIDPNAPTEVGEVAATPRATATEHAPDIDALSAEVAAGRLTAREAIDRLVDATAGPELGPTERAELRELLTALVANDPYLGALAGRV